MTKSKTKKLDIATICKNTLLVCSAITALGGAVGGLKEQFMGGDDKPAAVATPAAPTTIIIEQRAASEGRHMSKTVRVTTGGTVGAADPVADTPDTGGEPMAADLVAGSMMTQSAAPESSLTGWKLPWGWMMGIGMAIVGCIISVEILYKRLKGKPNANTDNG